MEAMCKQIHNTMVREFKYALVWGVSAKHYPQVRNEGGWGSVEDCGGACSGSKVEFRRTKCH